MGTKLKKLKPNAIFLKIGLLKPIAIINSISVKFQLDFQCSSRNKIYVIVVRLDAQDSSDNRR